MSTTSSAAQECHRNKKIHWHCSCQSSKLLELLIHSPLLLPRVKLIWLSGREPRVFTGALNWPWPLVNNLHYKTNYELINRNETNRIYYRPSNNAEIGACHGRKWLDSSWSPVDSAGVEFYRFWTHLNLGLGFGHWPPKLHHEPFCRPEVAKTQTGSGTTPTYAQN